MERRRPAPASPHARAPPNVGTLLLPREPYTFRLSILWTQAPALNAVREENVENGFGFVGAGFATAPVEWFVPADVNVPGFTPRELLGCCAPV